MEYIGWAMIGVGLWFLISDVSRVLAKRKPKPKITRCHACEIVISKDETQFYILQNGRALVYNIKAKRPYSSPFDYLMGAVYVGEVDCKDRNI